MTRGAVVKREERHIRVLKGRATLDVTPRRRGQEILRVYVSHGQIQVLGTMFTVQQRRVGGQVKLHRGAIRFVGHEGQVREVKPGQTLSWPLKDPPPLTATAPEEVAKSSPKKARPAKKLTLEETETLGNSTARLRSQGRYKQAARALRAALPRITDRVTRERFSFELGDILTYQLSDPAAACRHWKRHLRRYGPGRDGKEIRQAQQKAACPVLKKQ